MRRSTLRTHVWTLAVAVALAACGSAEEDPNTIGNGPGDGPVDPNDPSQQPQTPADERYLTLTTCNPEWSAEGRLIAYATMVGWQPIDTGMPAALAETLGAV